MKTLFCCLSFTLFLLFSTHGFAQMDDGSQAEVKDTTTEDQEVPTEISREQLKSLQEVVLTSLQSPAQSGIAFASYHNYYAGKEVISGNQFLDGEDWKQCAALFDGGEELGFKGRYDAYNDEFQVLKNDGKITAVVKDKVLAIVSSDKVFVPVQFVDKKGTHNTGFQELLVNGDMKLYKQYYAVKEKVNSHPLYAGRMSSEYRVEVKKQYYYKYKGKKAQYFKPSKKTILSIMSKKEKMIGQFAQENKLKPGREDHLILLFKKYNGQKMDQ